jgi:polygalacturonase
MGRGRLIFLGVFLFRGIAGAQDQRSVAEPHLPSRYCTMLEAQYATEDTRRLDTGRVQEAIDRCPAGEAVKLVPHGSNRFFPIAPIRLKTGVVLVVDAGAIVVASRNPRDYDLAPRSCGIVNRQGGGCQPLILAELAPGSGIMGEGTIDGRGGRKLAGRKVTWWDLAHQAKIKDQQQNCPRLLVVRDSENFTLYRITLRNSPNFHVFIDHSDGVTAWGVKILAPKTARNTDGIDPSSSSNVTIAHSLISTGDDNVAIKAGVNGPASHITIEDNYFYDGHGMSIGSETLGGVSAIRVRNLTIDGADNGIRIKSDRSRGGLVSDVIYENVCMRNVKNPIVLTTRYTDSDGNEIPVYRAITLRDVTSVTPGESTILGVDAEHRLEVRLDNVSVPGRVDAAHAVIFLGPRGADLTTAGEDVLVEGRAMAGHAQACAATFAHDFARVR